MRSEKPLEIYPGRFLLDLRTGIEYFVSAVSWTLAFRRHNLYLGVSGMTRQKRQDLCKLFVKLLNMLTLTLLSSFLFVIFVALILAWALLQTRCCGGEDADLVVVNDSGRDAYSIVLEYKNSTEAVHAANGGALLKSGQSYGLELEEDIVTVILRDRAQRTIGRSRVACQEGQRLFLTFDGVSGGSLCVEELDSFN